MHDSSNLSVLVAEPARNAVFGARPSKAPRCVPTWIRGWIDHLAKTLSEEYRPVRCTRCTGQVNSVTHHEEGSCTRRTATCLGSTIDRHSWSPLERRHFHYGHLVESPRMRTATKNAIQGATATDHAVWKIADHEVVSHP